MTKVYLTSVEVLGKTQPLPSKSAMINYRLNASENTNPRFAEVQERCQCANIDKFSELVKKLEGALLENRPLNLIVRTNEKHIEDFDQVVKIEF